MRLLLACFLAITATSAAAESIPWGTSFAAAKRQAVLTGRPMLVDFYTKGCGPCIKLDRETYTNRRVIRLTQRFIPVRIDAGRMASQGLVEKYTVSPVPFVAVIDGRGRMLTHFVGFKNPKAFEAAIRPFASKG